MKRKTSRSRIVKVHSQSGSTPQKHQQAHGLQSIAFVRILPLLKSNALQAMEKIPKVQAKRLHAIRI